MNRPATRSLVAVGLVALLALAACGSVTAKHSDGGGSGGTHADSSTKIDVAADRKAEDARHDALQGHDSISAKDMSVADARTTDARLTDARASDASSHGGSGGSSGGGPGGGGGGGVGGGGGDVGGACKTSSDCMLYTGAGSGCCGVCQPKSDPAPSMPECLIACLTPLVTCACTNQQCVGSKKML
ncbi:MAG TPA: hypothetical protein VI456_08790 [Polyangia bacterium]